jgi:acetyl-CoA synthetase
MGKTTGDPWLRAEQALQQWAEAAGNLVWDKPWDAVYVPDRPQGSWFRGGELNASVSCLDRHLPELADRVAVHWEGEPGERRSITYGELHAEVCSFAEALRGLGVRAGDRVALHVGWIPETVVSMLACARLGAVHVVVPSSLPPDALADRLDDVQPRVLVTQDGAWRHGVIVPSKARADEALAAVASVDHTVVVRRVGIDVAWYEGDRWYHDLVAAPRPGTVVERTAPVSVPADHPLLVIPIANRRGRPTGIVHRTGGYFVAAATCHQRALTPGPDDVFWCAAEIAWVGGQSHGVYGPLACGATAVMFEGTLDVPTRARAWELIERYRVSVLVTTPSVVRNLRYWVESPPARADLDSLRLIVTAGERIDPETRNWLSFEVGRGHATVADAWGQTELGGMVTITPTPDDSPGLPDAGLEVVDARGRPVASGRPGEVVMRHPWPGTFLEIQGSVEAAEEYWGLYPGSYATGDWGRMEDDGRIVVLGRRDPVVSISGQLVSLTEVRGILEEHPFVRDVEVVTRTDERRGQSVAACVVLEDKAEPGETLALELCSYVHDTLGGLARPRVVAFVESFPEDLPPEARHRALRLLCAANPAEFFTVTTAQLAAAAAAAATD